jgi:hypothetical protein
MKNNFNQAIIDILESDNKLSNDFLDNIFSYAVTHKNIKILSILFDRNYQGFKNEYNIKIINNNQITAKYIKRYNPNYNISKKDKKNVYIACALIYNAKSENDLIKYYTDKRRSIQTALLSSNLLPNKQLVETISFLYEGNMDQKIKFKIDKIIKDRVDLQNALSESSGNKLSLHLLTENFSISKDGYRNIINEIIVKPINKVLKNIVEDSYQYKAGYWGEPVKLSNLNNLLKNIDVLFSYNIDDKFLLETLSPLLGALNTHIKQYNLKHISMTNGCKIILMHQNNQNIDNELFRYKKCFQQIFLTDYDDQNVLEQVIINTIENIYTTNIKELINENNSFLLEIYNKVIEIYTKKDFIKIETYHRIIHLFSLFNKDILNEEIILNIINLTLKFGNPVVDNIMVIKEIINNDNLFFDTLLLKDIFIRDKVILDLLNNIHCRNFVLARLDFNKLVTYSKNNEFVKNYIYSILNDPDFNKEDIETISILSKDSILPFENIKKIVKEI